MVNKRVLIFAGVATVFIGVLLVLCRSPRAGLLIVDGPMVGFWQGFAHGFLIVINLVHSFFDRHIGIYELHNTGVGYNIGFVLGQAIWFASGKATMGWTTSKIKE